LRKRREVRSEILDVHLSSQFLFRDPTTEASLEGNRQAKGVASGRSDSGAGEKAGKVDYVEAVVEVHDGGLNVY
jgi:hypothetical protein